MPTPLIPKRQYELLGEIDTELDYEDRIEKLKEIISNKEFEPINRNTLKYCVEFFRELISYSDKN